MTSKLSENGMIMYIGCGIHVDHPMAWQYPCYICEQPTGRCMNFIGTEVYACGTCIYKSWNTNGVQRNTRRHNLTQISDPDASPSSTAVSHAQVMVKKAQKM